MALELEQLILPAVDVPDVSGGAMKGDASPRLIVPDRYITLDGAEPWIDVAANAPTEVFKISWPYDAIVIDWFATAQFSDGTDGTYAVGVSVAMGGPNNLPLTGYSQGISFHALKALFGCCNGRAPIYRRVKNGEVWSVQFKNHDAAKAAVASVSFGVRVLSASNCAGR